MNLQQNKDSIFRSVERIAEKSNRLKNSVKIIAVTKYVDCETARQLVNTGIQHIGENRVDKFLDKYQALKNENLTWHLIGSLQRRKVKDIINYVDYFHALDSIKLAQEIDKRAEHVIQCFLQVNISKEASKHGFQVEELDDVLSELEKLENIRLVGLMTMAPFEASHDELNQIFEATHQLQKELQKKQLKNMPFTDLSMGMSRDYPEAIANGATYVRIGTAFFE
ncbi:YggS family pyridoxal phosphate-dependent enzyme [Streptococcus sinensis]|uniref:Pyridoxal phosphate homeostasis protein n=1 Tax=Streptococcus sinensis TaxID=176090 RepID=A0A0A0DKG9_9STRE|nr:YggS family pyridoxal phosphate-dependent enzyme [Streptococcus sinensis]KGM37447.1 YggS protein [Streptococcus sinensis]MCF1284462.1 YggS family pyridoxal phosphate-dependent enzyme [Streptococcus sinensis]